MNCGVGSQGPSSTDTVSSLQKRIPILIANLWMQNKNVDIILLQECPKGTDWLDKTLKLLHERSKSSWDRIHEIETNTVGETANVIIFDTSKYKIDTSRNTQSATDEFNIDLKDPFAVNNTVKRHAYCRLLAQDGSNFQMDVLSFHGVENDTNNKTKRSKANKQTILQSYIETLYKKSKKNMIPILIGGDWNLEITQEFVEGPSKSNARLWKPFFVDMSCKRFQKNMIDYFIVFDYWGSYRSDKTIRLLNIVDDPVAKPHTDHKLAAQLDHDPVFVQYKTFAFDCKNSQEGNVPVFPRSLVSKYVNTETVRLQYDVNIIFPRRCMEKIIASATWGQLLDEQNDEIVLRYYFYKQGAYFYGSEVSPMEEEEEQEEQEVRSQQSSITYKDDIILTPKLHEYVVHLLEELKPERPKKSRISLTELRGLNTKEKKILHNVFDKKLFYSKGLPTLDAEIRILHEILGNEKQMWTKEEMGAFIDSELEIMVQMKQGKVLSKFKDFSTAQKAKFLHYVQLLLGYEIHGTTIQPRSMTLNNLKHVFGQETLKKLLTIFNVSPGQSTKEAMCQSILTLRDDMWKDLRSLEASKVHENDLLKSLQDFLKQQLPASDDALWQYMEDLGSWMMMPILLHMRLSSSMGNTSDNIQYTTPQQSVCDSDTILGSTTTTAGTATYELASATAGNNPAAGDPTNRNDIRRALQDTFDKVADTTDTSLKEEMRQIMQEDISSSSITNACAQAPSKPDNSRATVDSTIQNDYQTRGPFRDNAVPHTPQEDEYIKEIIRQGLSAIHDAIRRMKNKPDARLKKTNLWQLQRYLQQEKDPKDRSLGKFLDTRIQSDGTSGEYKKFQKKHKGAYAYTTYIMEYLVVKVGYDTGSKQKGFFARFF